MSSKPKTPRGGKPERDADVEAGREPPPYTQAYDWVAVSGVSPEAHSLYVKLAMHVNRDRGDALVWPGGFSLAKLMNVARADKIAKWMTELVKIDAVTIRRRGMPAHNVYVVHKTPKDDYVGPLTLKAWYVANRDTIDANKAAAKAKRDERKTREPGTNPQVTPVTPEAGQLADGANPAAPVAPESGELVAPESGEHVAPESGRKQDVRERHVREQDEIGTGSSVGVGVEGKDQNPPPLSTPATHYAPVSASPLPVVESTPDPVDVESGGDLISTDNPAPAPPTAPSDRDLLAEAYRQVREMRPEWTRPALEQVMHQAWEHGNQAWDGKRWPALAVADGLIACAEAADTKVPARLHSWLLGLGRSATAPAAPVSKPAARRCPKGAAHQPFPVHACPVCALEESERAGTEPKPAPLPVELDPAGTDLSPRELARVAAGRRPKAPGFGQRGSVIRGPKTPAAPVEAGPVPPAFGELFGAVAARAGR